MIDTVAFGVELTDHQFLRLREVSKEHLGRDVKEDLIEYRIVKGEITVGSYDSIITIRCYQSQMYAQFQVSLPKQLYGNNIQLLPCSRVEEALLMIETALRELVYDFPPYKAWLVDRLDLCYAWRFADHASAAGVLRLLSLLDFPRKRKSVYQGESIHWAGRAYAVKFYLKQPEFLRHDFRRIDSDERAYELAKFAEGVLRFEVSFRKRQFSEIFYGKTRIRYRELLDEEHIIELLNKYKNKLLSNLDTKLVADKDVIDKLKLFYPHKKSLRLYTFYKQFYSDSPHEKQLLKENYHQSTLWRNKHDLSVAGVGIRSDIPQLDFSLDIPSPLADTLLPPAGAGGTA